MEGNRRLKELKLQIYLVYIIKDPNFDRFKYFTNVLGVLSSTFGEEYHKAFVQMVEDSIAEGYLGASDKTLSAVLKKYFTVSDAKKLLRCSGKTFYERFGDYYERDYDAEYISKLKPLIKTKEGQYMVDILCDFIDKFNFEVGNDDNDLKDNLRTYELEFWLIYDHLISALRNSTMCDRFIANVCKMFKINYNSIFKLRCNLHLITRAFPHFSLNNRYFMQEVVTLYTHKGLSKGAIGSKVFHKGSNYLYNGTNKKYTVIEDKDIIWQYARTVDWADIDKEDIKKFIDVFHRFINYGIK